MSNHTHEGMGHPHAKKPIHHDWKYWTAAVLVLAAILVYILSLDEAIKPGADKLQQKVPAAVAP